MSIFTVPLRKPPKTSYRMPRLADRFDELPICVKCHHRTKSPVLVKGRVYHSHHAPKVVIEKQPLEPLSGHILLPSTHLNLTPQERSQEPERFKKYRSLLTFDPDKVL